MIVVRAVCVRWVGWLVETLLMRCILQTGPILMAAAGFALLFAIFYYYIAWVKDNDEDDKTENEYTDESESDDEHQDRHPQRYQTNEKQCVDKRNEEDPWHALSSFQCTSTVKP